jgi:hypothetical protein
MTKLEADVIFNGRKGNQGYQNVAADFFMINSLYRSTIV